MDHKQVNQRREESVQVPGLYVAFELANSTWKLACSDGNKLRHVTVTAGDLAQVQRSACRSQAAFRFGRQGAHGKLL